MGNSGKIDKTETSFKRSVLLIAIFASFLVPFLGSAVNLALPAIGAELGASAISLGWVVTSSMLASTIFLMPFGRLGDIAGRRRIFLYGIIFFTISSFLIIFSHSITSLIILRILQGVASSMIFGTSLAILTSVFPAGERGRAMGISVTSTYIGLSAGPVIGGVLTETIGWRSIFVILAILGLASVYLIVTRMKTEWAEAEGEKFDRTGSLIYGVSLFGFIFGFSRLPAATGWIFLISGILMSVIFFMFEKKVVHPVFDVKYFLKNRVLALSGLAALINYASTSAISFFISLYLQYLKGLDAKSAGIIMISQPVAMALLSPLAGRLSDRKNPGVIASAGMALTALGLVLFCFINASTPDSLIVLMLIVMGIGFGLFSSPNSNAIMSSVEKRYLGIASGIVGTMRMIGQMMSMGIAMMLISVFIGKQTINPDTYPGLLSSMRTGFIIFSVLSIFGIFASIARNPGLAEKTSSPSLPHS